MGRVSKDEMEHYESQSKSVRLSDGRFFVLKGAKISCPVSTCKQEYLQERSRLSKLIRCDKCGSSNTILVDGKALSDLELVESATGFAQPSVPAFDKESFDKEFFSDDDRKPINLAEMQSAGESKDYRKFLQNVSTFDFGQIWLDRERFDDNQKQAIYEVANERNLTEKLRYYDTKTKEAQVAKTEAKPAKPMKDVDEYEALKAAMAGQAPSVAPPSIVDIEKQKTEIEKKAAEFAKLKHMKEIFKVDKIVTFIVNREKGLFKLFNTELEQDEIADLEMVWGMAVELYSDNLIKLFEILIFLLLIWVHIEIVSKRWIKPWLDARTEAKKKEKAEAQKKVEAEKAKKAKK